METLWHHVIFTSSHQSDGYRLRYSEIIKYIYEDCQFSLAMMITKISKRLEDEIEIRLDLSMMKRIFLVDFLLLIIFTIIYLTCFGCLFITSNPTAQTATVSSEGVAGELYPDSMGEYQLAEEMIQKSEEERKWYRHKNRDDRFIMYSTLGNIIPLMTSYAPNFLLL